MARFLRWQRARMPGVGRAVTCLAVAGLLVATLAPPAPADYVGTGTHPWAIVLCNFTNQQLDPAPASYFASMYGNGGSGSGQFNFVDFWHDVSFNQLSVAGTTVITGSHADSNGWYTVAEPRDTWGYSRDRYGKIVDCENAALPDVNFHNYYGVVAIFPEAAGNLTAAITASDTSVTVTNAAGSTSNVTTTNYWPTAPFMMNIQSETVNVTAAHDNGDGTETFTITRGANGTAAAAHPTVDSNGNAVGAGVPGDFGEVTGGSHVGTPPGLSNVTLSDSNVYQLAQVILPNEANLTGAGHETGHGFGYNHSRKLSFSTVDYKDATDIMSAYDSTYETGSLGTSFGGAVLGSVVDDKGPGLDAIDLDFQGWIPSGRHLAFNNSSPPNQSTLTLHALSDPNALTDSSDPLEARVPASVTIQNADPSGAAPTSPPTCSGTGFGCTTSQYYTVEYRQKTGWDSGFPASAVVLHLFGADNRSYWVDQLPKGHNGLLYAGDEYVDAANNTYVAVNSISGSSAQVTLGSARITPALTWSGDTSGDYNDQVTLAADLTVGGAPVPNEPVQLTAGLQGCAATTDAAGHASCTLTLAQDPASTTASASFAGDTAYAAVDSTPAAFTVNQEDTRVTFNGAASGDYHDPASVSATLTDPTDATPIAGKAIVFTIGTSATDTCTATTGADGVAGCTVTPTQVPAAYTMHAAFAGDTDYAASADAGTTFTITKEETTATYTGPTVILQGASGVTLTAQLFEDTTATASDPPTDPVAGRTMALGLGSQTCTGTTDGTGTASCSLAFTGALGPEPLSATFAGDAYYLPSQDTSKTAIVFAFPTRGAFALGDKTVAAGTTPVTWWGDNWYLLNSLSGGVAPSSFKGFIGTIALPTSTPPASCGGNWSTLPGNSPPPTAGVPSYMGVIVPGTVTKSGNPVSGNTTHIVVVTTNPGYAPNPQSHGTGTIVATFC